MYTDKHPRPGNRETINAHDAADPRRRSGCNQADAECPDKGRVVAGEGVVRRMREQSVPQPDHERSWLEIEHPEHLVYTKCNQHPPGDREQPTALRWPTPYPQDY